MKTSTFVFLAVLTAGAAGAGAGYIVGQDQQRKKDIATIDSLVIQPKEATGNKLVDGLNNLAYNAGCAPEINKRLLDAKRKISYNNQTQGEYK